MKMMPVSHPDEAMTINKERHHENAKNAAYNARFPGNF